MVLKGGVSVEKIFKNFLVKTHWNLIFKHGRKLSDLLADNPSEISKDMLKVSEDLDYHFEKIMTLEK